MSYSVKEITVKRCCLPPNRPSPHIRIALYDWYIPVTVSEKIISQEQEYSEKFYETSAQFILYWSSLICFNLQFPKTFLRFLSKYGGGGGEKNDICAGFIWRTVLSLDNLRSR